MSFLQTMTRIKMSFHEQRRSMRQHVQFPAWVDIGDGAPPHDCTVLDVSDDGARIMLASSLRLPTVFHLVYSNQATRRRRCRLVWRLDDQIGVNYLGPLETEPMRC